MAQKTDAELLAAAQQIRDETDTDDNTATRVGGHMVDTADSKINKQVNGYPLSGGFVAGSFIPIWNDTIGRVEHIPAETLQGSTDVSIYEYDNVTNYVVDEVVTHLGLWYQALAINGPGSTIVEPGTNGAVWEEISKALPGVLPWEAGAYIEDEVFVLAQVSGAWGLYHLIDATRPYVSSNFDTELAAADWEITATVAAWSGTTAGTVERSTQAESEAIITQAQAGATTGLSDARTPSEIGLYHFIRKFLTLAWTWTLGQTFTVGPIVSDATASLMAAFNGSKKLVSIAYATVADLVAQSDAVKPITSSILGGYRSLNAISVTLSAANFTLAFSAMVEALFNTSTAIAANATVTITETNAKVFVWQFGVTGTVALDFSAMTTNIVFEQTEVSLGRWNSTTKILTLTGTTNTEFEIIGVKRGSVWRCISNKYI